MAFYVKANQKVAEFLKLTEDRWKLSDGNYLLWMNDMLAFGRLSDIADIVKRIGAVVLEPWQAKLETDGKLCAPVPAAEDERFYVEPTVTEGPADEIPTEDVPAEPESEPEQSEPTEPTDEPVSENEKAPEEGGGA